MLLHAIILELKGLDEKEDDNRNSTWFGTSTVSSPLRFKMVESPTMAEASEIESN